MSHMTVREVSRGLDSSGRLNTDTERHNAESGYSGRIAPVVRGPYTRPRNPLLRKLGRSGVPGLT